MKRSPLEAVRDNLHNVSIVLDQYRETYNQQFESDVKVKGKSIERACVEHASLLAFWDEKRIQLRAVVHYLELHVEKIYGQKFKDYTERYSRELSTKDKDNYIKHDAEYVALKEILIDVHEVYGLYESAVDNFKDRGYVLNHITRAKVAAVSDVIL